MVVQQRQRTPAMDKHVLIIENAKPASAPVAPVPVAPVRKDQ